MKSRARRRRDAPHWRRPPGDTPPRRVTFLAHGGRGKTQSSRFLRTGPDGRRRRQAGDRPPAIARAIVRMSPETAATVERGDAPKGDVLGTARIAGIQAAKRTDELIPLAHRSRSRSSTSRPDRPGRPARHVHRRGPDDRPHRRRDGGAHGLHARGAHRLRHGQGARTRGHDRGGRPLEKTGGKEDCVAATDLGCGCAPQSSPSAPPESGAGSGRERAGARRSRPRARR